MSCRTFSFKNIDKKGIINFEKSSNSTKSSKFEKGLKFELKKKLDPPLVKMDIEWLREHTRLTCQASIVSKKKKKQQLITVGIRDKGMETITV